MKHTKTFGKWFVLLVILALLVTPIAAFAQGNSNGNDGNGGGQQGSTNWHLYGTVTTMPAGGLGQWAIDDEVFLADENTVLGNEYGELVEGAYAHAVGNYDEFEKRIAYRIETKSDYEDCQCDCEDNWRLYGEVEAMPADGGLTGDWIIAGEDVSASIATNFRERFGPLEVGATVVAAGCTEDEELVACMIATVSDQCDGSGECDGSGGGGNGDGDGVCDGTGDCDGSGGGSHGPGGRR